MITQGYIDAAKKIAWAYSLIYLHFNIGTIDLLPDWAGFLLIASALPEIAKQEPSADLLKGFCYGLAIYFSLVWLMGFFDMEINLSWAGLLIDLVVLYFHFQLLTNLAQTAEKYGLKRTKDIRALRTFQTVLITAVSLVSIFSPEELLYGWPAVLLSLFIIGFLIGIIAVLFAYVKDLRSVIMPVYVRDILRDLEQAGYEAYVVGGCVRDFLMGKTPADWDVCTSAKPQQIKDCLADRRLIETGICHGTVTAVVDGKPVEITTYRIDGEYKDGRHPETVEFTSSLEEDLARRDFTINAMAYHPEKGLSDPFGGQAALANREIRCVGVPGKRFTEDALRIMRGLRFAATLGFRIGSATEDAMRRYAQMVEKVSRERVNVELSKLLLGFDADRVMTDYGDILTVAVPGLLPAKVDHLPDCLPMRLAAVFPKDTEQYLRELKYSSETVRQSATLVRLCAKGRPPQDAVEIKKLLSVEGEEIIRLYFAMFGNENLVQAVLDSGACWNLKQLAVSGSDLIELGMKPGKDVGALLCELLQLVIEEKLDNRREELLEYSRKKVKL